MTNTLAAGALDQLFRSARSYNGWTAAPVEEGSVRDLYELLKWGPTSANSSPARFVWVRSPEGKAKLAELAWERNRPKVLAAPLTVIVGNDLAFADRLPELMPHNYEAMQKAFAPPPVAEVTAMRNGTLQGAYLVIAARALGLDCGPMSGFDNAGVDAAFFGGTRIRSNFICSIGHGDPQSIFPRNPRLSFEEAGRFE
ncbi:malonic semialdehyde reductase [Sphingomonas sp.]|uniref:malonic semialdehyde reductase n=1 Tax=Sphingomonas sp. TaxID=28214 RepID=UPI0025D12982|nr:malonic semialdehyde reductase [Sphingomonas sp.]MBV9527252.1 malonic semialdehyde reductase [Sphingomonas sp.]